MRRNRLFLFILSSSLVSSVQAQPERYDILLRGGTILDGTETVEQVGHRLLDKIVSVASGERTQSELNGMGDEEFAPWQLGPTF